MLLYTTFSRTRKNRRVMQGQRILSVFLSAWSLYFIGANIIGHLGKTTTSNPIIFEIKDRFPNITTSTESTETIPRTVKTIFVHGWRSIFKTPSMVLIDNGPQFTSKIFQTIWEQRGMQPSTATKYHPQTKRQVKNFNDTIISRHRRYIVEHQ